jgi:hypothetical protein
LRFHDHDTRRTAGLEKQKLVRGDRTRQQAVYGYLSECGQAMGWAAWTSIATAVSAVVALFTFLFAVWNTFQSARRESNRRDWERLQALAQVLHQGPQAGEWAQKLAIRELADLKTKKVQALLLAEGALTYWESRQAEVPSGLLAELRKVIDELSE